MPTVDNLSPADAVRLEQYHADRVTEVAYARLVALPCLGCGTGAYRCPDCDAHVFAPQARDHAMTCAALRKEASDA